MPDIEFGALQGVRRDPSSVHELHRPLHLARELLVLRVSGVVHEALVPLLHGAQVGEPALCKGADEVQRRRRFVVCLEHPLGVGDAGRFGELVLVDDVASEGGQGHTVSRLLVRGARLGVLAYHASHLHDRH